MDSATPATRLGVREDAGYAAPRLCAARVPGNRALSIYRPHGPIVWIWGEPRTTDPEASLSGKARRGERTERGEEERSLPELLPVGFPQEMPPERRRAYRAVLAYFLAVVVALMWPVYPLASRIRPRVLGFPFSLAYLVILLLGSFVVLLGLFIWEGRQSAPASGEGPPEPGPGEDDA